MGKSARVGALSIKYRPNGTDTTRLAVVVSKKVAKSAPTRNRIRRRLFETARRKWPQIAPGFDIIISVFEESVKVTPQEKLDALLDQLLSKARLTS
jgi:ribonuclease P protein component